MSGYAIVNLLELDDSVGGRVPGLEGRFGRNRLGSRDLGGDGVASDSPWPDAGDS